MVRFAQVNGYCLMFTVPGDGSQALALLWKKLSGFEIETQVLAMVIKSMFIVHRTYVHGKIHIGVSIEIL